MSDKCPVCGQPLPTAIDQDDLQARIQRIASTALVAERKKLKGEFDVQLSIALAKARQNDERQFQQRLRAAEVRVQKDAQLDIEKQLLDAEKRVREAEATLKKNSDRVKKEAEDRLKKEIAVHLRNSTRDNELKLQKLQNDREREKIRYEAESAKLQGQLEALSRKLEGQSGEQLGAEAELDLFTDLRRVFCPEDEVKRVGRGLNGADIVHEVRDGTKVVGRIVYESKNTGTWNKTFIEQAKKYKTQYDTPHVLIVTRAFPPKNKGLCIVSGVPVVDKRMATAMASVIREGIIEIAKLRLSGKSSDEKSQELYKYIVGDGFCTRFRELAECVTSLREQQQQERTSHERMWHAESKIHERMQGRQREVEAQIRAIVRGGTGLETLKLAASSETWRGEAGIIRQGGRA